MRRHVRDLIALAGLGLVTGCPDRSISEVNPVQQGVVKKDIPVSADIDILFVIDNSASTQDKQTVFASNFANFVTALDAFPTGRPNLHIGVVDSTVDIGVQGFGPGCPSPDANDNGLLQNTAHGMCTPPTGRYISDIAGPGGSAAPRVTNYTGTLGDTLACIAEIGASGCGFEAPLEGMKRALDNSLAQNTGFVRDGAYLAVIFLTDEDDASVKEGSAGSTVFTLAANTVGGLNDFRVQPLFAYNCDTPITAGSGSANYTNCVPRTDSYLQDPAFYSSFLSTVKGDASRVVVAVIAGPPPPPFKTQDAAAATQTANITYGAGANTIGIGSLNLNVETQDPALLPSCSATINGDMAIGRPAIRLASFLAPFGDHGRFYNICQPDYSAALADIGSTLFNAISPCLEGPLDTRDSDPNNPGTQLQCDVSDVLNFGGSDATATPIPACAMVNTANTVMDCTAAPCPDPAGTRPCWWTHQDTMSCPAPDTGYTLTVERTTPAAPGTTVDVACALVAQ